MYDMYVVLHCARQITTTTTTTTSFFDFWWYIVGNDSNDATLVYICIFNTDTNTSTSADVRTDATASSTATCHHHHRQGMYQHWGSKWMVLAKFSMPIGYEKSSVREGRSWFGMSLSGTKKTSIHGAWRSVSNESKAGKSWMSEILIAIGLGVHRPGIVGLRLTSQKRFPKNTASSFEKWCSCPWKGQKHIYEKRRG